MGTSLAINLEPIAPPRKRGYGKDMLRVIGICALLILGCNSKGVEPGAKSPETEKPAPEPAATQGRPLAAKTAEPFVGGGQVPIESDDALLGGSRAPVTIVAFMDLECPFSKRVLPTLESMMSKYGNDVRLVFKHNPLPFHKMGMPAAQAAQIVLAAKGPQAFWRYVALVYDDQEALKDRGVPFLEDTALQIGIDRDSFAREMNNPTYEQQVARDIVVSRGAGVSGTPGFLINGLRLSGAQPKPKFESTIDAELPKARQALATATSAIVAYDARVKENFSLEPSANKAPAAPDNTVWKIPVTGSPVRGPNDALVTIVEFIDLECPFSFKVQPALDAVLEKYGNKVRLVFKHNPLAFHKRARPAAQFANYVYKRGGSEKFFEAVGVLFLNQKDLSDQTFKNIASQLGLDPEQALREMSKQEAVIAADQGVADDFEARGTPHFFINGKRLTGAQPVERFVERIDAALVEAEALLKQGVPARKIYEHTLKDGKKGGEFEWQDVAAPSSSNPRLGTQSNKSPVVVQMFGDLQCPFCAKVMPTIRELVAAYPGRVQVAWRHFPLPFHNEAPLAAEVAQEVWVQKGNDGFWQFVDLLYANKSEWTQNELRDYAQRVDIDVKKLDAALADHRHRTALEADMAAGKQIGVKGIPAFTINGYFVSGAQPIEKFKKVVDYAIKNPKKK
jgi:protein-disulfide isomerase